MYTPEQDDDEVSPEEMAEIEADLIAQGFMTSDGKVDWEALHNQPGIPFTEFDEWYEKKLGEEEAQNQQTPK